MKLDKRRKYWIHRHRNLGLVALGIVIGLIIMGFSFRAGQGHLLNPDASTPCSSALDPKCKNYQPVPAITPTPDPTSDPLSYIRWLGESKGYTSYEVSKFIRIARAESYDHLDPFAKNPISTASGIYMFTDGTWARYCVGDKLNFVDSINCFYHVLESDGYPKGLSHWEESRSKWE